MATALRFLALLAVLMPTFFPSLPAQTGPVCGYDPLIAGMFSQTSQDRWTDWIAGLSGEKPVQVGGQTVSITSRQNRLMAERDPSAHAFEYVKEIVTGWLGSRAQIDAVPYLMYKPPDDIYNAANLIVDLPGATHPEEIIVLSAHLDSYTANLIAPAPGADDNGGGVAALLEAARIFRQYRFARTVRLAFFTGEEQYEVGSRAYLYTHPPKGVTADINLDMFSYDLDNDHCLELHTAMLPASQPLAQCFQQTIPAYRLDLKTEIITGAASQESDQSSFWAYGIGALMVAENITLPGAGSVCAGTDVNPYYHSSNDRIVHINLATGFAAARAGIATAASLAGPLALCRSEGCRDETADGKDPAADTYWRALVDHAGQP